MFADVFVPTIPNRVPWIPGRYSTILLLVALNLRPCRGRQLRGACQAGR